MPDSRHLADPTLDAAAAPAVNPTVDARLDAAIARYPMVALPPGFVERTMLRIAADAAPAGVDQPATQPVPRHAPPAGWLAPSIGRPAPRFRLGFLDLVLPIFFTGLLCSVVALGVWSLGRVNPLWGEYLKLDVRLAWQSAQLLVPPALRAGLLLGGSLGLAIGLGVLLMLGVPATGRRPAPFSRRRTGHGFGHAT